MVIDPAKQDVADLLENNNNESNSLQDQINGTEQNINALDNSLSQQSQAIIELTNKLFMKRHDGHRVINTSVDLLLLFIQSNGIN